MKKKIYFLLKVFLVLFVFLNVMAAFHAYKFTHFYADTSLRRPKPEEMSIFDKTGAVLFGVDYPKSVVDQSPATAHTIITIKNKHIQLEGWMMPVPNAKGTVILFHGHGSSKSKIINEARAFNEMGYNSFPMDFRAHGNSGGNVCTIGYDEAEDVKLAYDYIVSTGEKNIILWGISMGAAAITHAVTKYELTPSRLILEMPFGSLYDAVKGRVRTMGLPEQPISTLLTFWGGIERGFWAFDYEPADYAKQLRMPVLLQWGTMDKRVTAKETEELFDHLASHQKKLVKYQRAVHESLLKKQPGLWKAEVAGFLEHGINNSTK